MSPPIIENPRRQGAARRVLQGTITLILWGVWLYLMLPLFAPLVAMAGLGHGLLSGIETVNHLGIVFPIAMFIAVLMLGMDIWVRYNIFLHQRASRKMPQKVVYREQLARHFGVPLHKLAGWHYCGQMLIRLTEYGKIREVELKSPPKPRFPAGARKNSMAGSKTRARHPSRSGKQRRRLPLNSGEPVRDNSPRART